MRNDDLLWAMALTFFTTAIFSFGGIATMIPEIHRQAVDIRGWLGNDDFATAFALSQIAPGPNILLMSMIGWRVAGWAGLAVATLATIVPTSLIALLAGRGEARIANTRWYMIAKRALPPIVVGLILSSGVVTGHAAIDHWLGVAIAGGVAIHIALSRTNPLIPLGIGTAIGIAAARLGFF